jgi:hypothetical protein
MSDTFQGQKGQAGSQSESEGMAGGQQRRQSSAGMICMS